MIEFRFRIKDAARKRYEFLVEKGYRCNLSSDGFGVIVFNAL